MRFTTHKDTSFLNHQRAIPDLVGSKVAIRTFAVDRDGKRMAQSMSQSAPSNL